MPKHIKRHNIGEIKMSELLMKESEDKQWNQMKIKNKPPEGG